MKEMRKSTSSSQLKTRALKFVLLIGVMSFFADFTYEGSRSIIGPYLALLGASAVAVSGGGSLLFGRLFDRLGLVILVPLTILSALFAPLVFLWGFWAAIVGMALWGLGMGVHDSIIPAAVTLMVPATRRASAFGLFTAGYGIFWFLGSALIGVLYSVSLTALIAFSLIAELAAIPFFLLAWRSSRPLAVA